MSDSSFKPPPPPSHAVLVPKEPKKGIFNLNRKVCIVTGGSSGFGEAIVKRLVASGAIVVIFDLDEVLGRKLADTLTELYTGELDSDACSFRKCNVGDLTELKREFEWVINKFGTLDVMVNNAGIGNGDGAFLESMDPTKAGDDDGWKLMNDVNINAVTYGTQLALATFSKANKGKGKAGVIINISSMASIFPQDDAPIYAAGKAYVTHLTRSVQASIQDASVKTPPKIRINAICPAPAPTKMLNDMVQTASPMSVRLYEQRKRMDRSKPWMASYSVSINDVAEASMQAIIREDMFGASIRITPKGIDVWNHRDNTKLMDLKSSL